MYLPGEDDNDPDVPIPIVEEALEEEEAVIAQEGYTNQDHEAPPSNVDMSDTETVSILDGDEEANTSIWTTVPKTRTK